MERDKLIDNMTDQIKEAQLKLGYAEETVRLYYPLSSLCMLLGVADTDSTDGTSGADAADARTDFAADAKAAPAADAGTVLAALKAELEGWEDCPLGKLSVCFHGDRVEIGIPPEGVRYVHEQVKTPAFLSALIGLFQTKHHCSIEDVRKVFESFQEDYVCEKLSQEAAERMGFDYVLYFKDGAVDAYYYCIKEEMGHTVYHRFTREDYERL